MSHPKRIFFDVYWVIIAVLNEILYFFFIQPHLCPKSVHVILSNRFFQLMQNVYKELRDTVELSNFRQYVNSEIIENENGL